MLVVAAAAVLALGALTFWIAPSVAAGALLHPARTIARQSTPAGCADESLNGAGVILRGWRCAASIARRGSVIYLHGIADNRGSASGIITRFIARGLDVIAYDSRAHGESGGEMCTYGYYEKDDLRRVIDTLAPGPVILIGTSLGAAVALQEAAEDARVSGVVAAEVFSDLATVARERAPRWVPTWILREGFCVAGERGKFELARAAPVRAAAFIHVPVLLIHGAADLDTKPDHTERVLAALHGPKRLILVPGARHNESLRDSQVWAEIDQWVETVIADDPQR